MPRTYTITVTGALGLLGAGITTAALSQGHSIIAIDIRDTDEDEQLLKGIGEITPEDVQLRRAAINAAPGRYSYKQVDLTLFDATKAALEGTGCDALIHLAAIYAQKDAEGRYISGPQQHVGACCLTDSRVLTDHSPFIM